MLLVNPTHSVTDYETQFDVRVCGSGALTTTIFQATDRPDVAIVSGSDAAAPSLVGPRD